MPPQPVPIEIRFSRYFIRKGPNDCWEWTNYLCSGGYGRIGVGNGVKVLAHVFAWELANNKKVPHGMCICHKCDNPPCVNPAHLFLGTLTINNLDMYMKGRNRTNGNELKKYCVRGHEFNEENTYITPSTGVRQCRACARSRYDRQ